MNRLRSNSAEADIPFKNLNVAAKIIKNFENKKVLTKLFANNANFFASFHCRLNIFYYLCSGIELFSDVRGIVLRFGKQLVS